MEEAPTPKAAIKNNNLEENEIISQDSSGLIFQINITKYDDYIEIKCMDTESNKNYSNKFNSKSLKEITGENNIDKVYQILKDITGENTMTELKDDIIIFSINSTSIKKNFKLYETLDINDALILIKELRNENNNLKNRLDEMEKKIENMNLNCEYNLFDVESYKLENIFKELTKGGNTKFNLHTSLINNRAELGLINKGIKHIFNSNITFMEMIYCSKKDGEEPEYFNAKYNENLIYSVIIIRTKDKNQKKFGIFCNKQKKTNLELQNMNVPFNENNQGNQPLYGQVGLFNQQNNNFNNNYQDRVRAQTNLYSFDNKNNNNLMSNMMDINNMNNNNLMINNNMQTMMNNNINIFSSNSISNDYFLFSLSDFSIYYSNESNYFPEINIEYNSQYKCLFGNEKNLNTNMNNNNSNFKLSGNNQFNIDEYELYNIYIENQNHYYILPFK